MTNGYQNVAEVVVNDRISDLIHEIWLEPG